MPKGVKGSGSGKRKSRLKSIQEHYDKKQTANGATNSPNHVDEGRRQRRELKRKQEDDRVANLKKKRLEEHGMRPYHDLQDEKWFNEKKRPFLLYPPEDSSYLPPGKVEVVVDPRLSNELQQHQRDGIKKMYNHLNKIDWDDPSSRSGFILADGMGLGKTLQCITVLLTFLTQSPDWCPIEKKVKPLIKKAIVVCPPLLISVWEEELGKWLVPQKNKHDQIKLCVIDDKVKSRDKKVLATEFMQKENTQQCLITTYDTFKILTRDYQINDKVNDDLLRGPLAENQDGIVGLLICDEAHYIKNDQCDRNNTIMKFKVKMRIALTGTPIQNNLDEYYALLAFVNPYFTKQFPKQKFNDEFQEPIKNYILDRTYEPGHSALLRLRRIIQPFCLRRTVNPSLNVDKTEYIICCKTMNTDSDFSLQFDLYNACVKAYSEQLKLAREEKKKKGKKIYVNSFQMIHFLKSLCCHPDMVRDEMAKWSADDTPFFNPLMELYINFDMEHFEPYLSTKMSCLLRLLQQIKDDETTKDRVVIVSYYTSVLDMIEMALKERKYPFVRCDGTSTNKNRQKLIKKFNDPKEQNQFIMTLSCRAAGCGISLIGANFLIMFDPDWNPFNDDQAMARIYREGQQKNCHMYRFITTGSIEEEQFKRQIFKKLLAGQVLSYGKGNQKQKGIFVDPNEENYNHSNFGVNGHSNGRTNGHSPRLNSIDDVAYLEETIKETDADGTPVVSLTHSDLECELCDTVARKQNKEPSAAECLEKENSDELNLHLWRHIYSPSDERLESHVLAYTWQVSPADISMIFMRKTKPQKAKKEPEENDDNDDDIL